MPYQVTPEEKNGLQMQRVISGKKNEEWGGGHIYVCECQLYNGEGQTLSVCPVKNRCLPEAISTSTTREWQGYSTLLPSALNSTCSIAVIVDYQQFHYNTAYMNTHTHTHTHVALTTYISAYTTAYITSNAHMRIYTHALHCIM